LLMVLLVTLTGACATSKGQPNPYDECMSLCGDEVSDCVQSCYRWRWSAKKLMDCINECNQKSEKCQKLCSKLKEPNSPRIPGYYNQGGDAG
jgi:hypothetical protein